MDAIGIWKFLGESNMGLSKEYPCKEEGGGSYAPNIPSERGRMRGKNGRDLLWKQQRHTKVDTVEEAGSNSSGQSERNETSGLGVIVSELQYSWSNFKIFEPEFGAKERRKVSFFLVTIVSLIATRVESGKAEI